MKHATTCAAAALAAFAAFAETPRYAENLAVWYRADLGVTLNAAGGVTRWANQGTVGSSADLEPSADNSAAHVSYSVTGMNGKPAISFDRTMYLKTASATDCGITSANGAWFVVFKTPLAAGAERNNMGIFGNATRFGAFFASSGQICNTYFATGGNTVGGLSATADAVQIATAMCWTEGGSAKAYAMMNLSPSKVTTNAVTPGSTVLNVGNMMPSWGAVMNFKGEIAELRIYDRALTGRERAQIQFELFSRYGVHFGANGGIDDNALAWCDRSAQFGYNPDEGLPEDVAASCTVDGVTAELTATPAASESSRGYLAHNGGTGLANMWYVANYSAIREKYPLKLTFRRSAARFGKSPSLWHKSSYGGSWTKKDAEIEETDDAVSFTLPGGWVNGFYAVFGDLDSSMSLWLRADMGVETDANGAVVKWANQGVCPSLDMSPAADNSAAHVALAEDGIGGKPAVSFDGGTYLRSAGASSMDITSEGGAWFVVYETDQSADERRTGNRAIFGSCPDNSQQRFGAFFPANTDNVNSYFYHNTAATLTVETGKPQVLAMMQFPLDGAGCRYGMRAVIATPNALATANPGRDYLYVGGRMLSWTGNYVGKIAEIRVYSRPLTVYERSQVQFELCSRYGVAWEGHGGITDEALAWHERSAQFGWLARRGAETEIAASAESGGATLSFDETPGGDSLGYMANDGGDGLERTWYVSAPSEALAMYATLAFDGKAIGAKNVPMALWRSATPGGEAVRVGVQDAAPNGTYYFPLAAGKWQGGYYKLVKAPGLFLILR